MRDSARASTVCGAERPIVLVTGANGKAGKLIASKIHESEDFALRALCRSEEGKTKLKSELNLADEEIVVADVANSDLKEAVKGCTSMIVATSATPKLIFSSMPAFFWKKFVMKEKVMPGFSFPASPEQVDWLGQKAQFDAAKEAGLKHVVVVSSMGGTQPDNTLNLIGDGNILVWKRKAEQYLIASGLTYTIIHPGGLKGEKGPSGQSGIVLGLDDKLLERPVKNIARADVAELCVQSLRCESAKNRSIDCINDESATIPSSTSDFESLFSSLKGDCDYSINPSP